MIRRAVGGLKVDLINLFKIILWLPLLPISLLLFIVFYLISLPRKYHQPPVASKDSVIIITGCDSGIGKATTIKLVREGFHVISSVFTEEVLKTSISSY